MVAKLIGKELLLESLRKSASPEPGRRLKGSSIHQRKAETNWMYHNMNDLICTYVYI